MPASARPLRILAIVNLPWDPRLGAARVWIELTDEWIRAGHRVEKFSLTDAYPHATTSSVRSLLRQTLFPYRAAKFVRQNVDRFDVIDCLIGTLPYPKRSLRFRGLLVARSVGLYRLYEKFLQQSRRRWPDQPKGRWSGRPFHRFVHRRFWDSCEAAVRHCDLLNLPNDDERSEIARDNSISAPAIVQPYGLRDEFREAFASAAAPAERRLRAKKICFIGMWSVRKGSRDWRAIINAVWQRHPQVEFVFLGTMCSEKIVRTELGLSDSNRITCRPTYDAADLPTLLADATLGLFPSYIEGFGLAVLEQLAAGLPTIAYDVPGPRQILHPQRELLLTPAGDPGAMAARAVHLLSLTLADYKTLSTACREIARRYRWETIAAETITHYRNVLYSLGEPAPSPRLTSGVQQVG